MPEHLRAFVVVAVLGLGVFFAVSRPLGALIGLPQLQRWQKAWFLVTAAAFVSGNFWLYAVLLIGVIAWLRPSPQEAAPLFFALAFAVPASGIEVPGFGIINYLFEINHIRLLALLLLLPAFLRLASGGGRDQVAKFPADRWFFSYLLLTCVLQFRQSTFTDSLRSCFLIGLDMFLPYYVFSRAVSGVSDIKRVMVAYVMAAAVMGLLGLFEMLRTWNLYAALVHSLDTSWGFGGYLLRDGMQRASVTTGQAIAFGFTMVVGLGFWMSLRQQLPRFRRAWVPSILLVAGLLAGLSRGPWLGAVLLYVVIALTSPGGFRTVAGRAMLVLALLPLVMITPWGDRIINLLPFVGTVDSENVDYRSRLIDNSLIVIERNLFLGSPYYLNEPEMRAMYQGQGIIDVVNSYIAVALNFGVVGLFLFCMIFLSALFGVYRAMRRLPEVDASISVRYMGQCLIGVLLAIMFMIFTVSSISVIGLIYWCVLGIAGAYAVSSTPGSHRTQFPAQLR